MSAVQDKYTNDGDFCKISILRLDITWGGGSPVNCNNVTSMSDLYCGASDPSMEHDMAS